MNSQPLLLLLILFLVLRHASAAASYPKQALPTKSGYLSVNPNSNSSIFYTFYESQTPSDPTKRTTPLLIWLQGGPGCSSQLANFRELGPYLLDQNLTLHPNPYSWNRLFGLAFFDNPIGTGFSIAASPDEIPTTQSAVANHLFIALTNFISLDKSFKTRPIYLTGESYAGKYLPAFGAYVAKRNAVLPVGKRLNIAGIAIGNGLTDPEIQVSTHAVNSYNLGLINKKQMYELEKIQKETIRFIRAQKWNEASDTRAKVLSTLTNMTGLATLYDFRRLTPYPNKVVAQFLNHADVKKALGAKESIVFELCSGPVGDALHADVMKSVRGEVEFLLKKKMRVLLYQGQADLRDGVMSSLEWMERMKWEGIVGFLGAERKVWRVGEGLAGYVQRFGSLSHAVVLNAGHLVPTDQPLNSQVLMQDWILGRGLFG